jgi:hypothetical protein
MPDIEIQQILNLQRGVFSRWAIKGSRVPLFCLSLRVSGNATRDLYASYDPVP